ncbi:alpha/beta fold hydrolase [Gordonia sp. NPDC003429]
MTDHVPDWVDPELYPFTGAWIDVAGHHIHYLDEGSGPTLLMVHGNPTWSFVYRDVITALRNDFRCVAIDLPGFGLSTAAEDFNFLPASHAEVVAWSYQLFASQNAIDRARKVADEIRAELTA